MERRKRAFGFSPRFFVLFYIQRCYHVPDLQYRVFFSWKKVRKIEFSPAYNAEHRERDDARTGETGAGRQSDKRPEMHRSPEMLVDVLHSDFRRYRSRYSARVPETHLRARPLYRPEFSVAEDIAHKSIPRELVRYIQTRENLFFLIYRGNISFLFLSFFFKSTWIAFFRARKSFEICR